MDTGPPRLTAETVAAEGGNLSFLGGLCNFTSEETGGDGAPTQTPEPVRWDRGHNGDLFKPWSKAQSPRESAAQRSGQLVVAAVFQSQDRSTEHTLVGTPQDGRVLRRR